MGHLDKETREVLKILELEASAAKKYAERIYETHDYFQGLADQVQEGKRTARSILLAGTRFLEYAESSIKAKRLGDTIGYVIGVFEFGILGFKYENEDLREWEAEVRDLLELAKKVGHALFEYDKERNLEQKAAEAMKLRKKDYNHRGWTRMQKKFIRRYIKKFE